MRSLIPSADPWFISVLAPVIAITLYCGSSGTPLFAQSKAAPPSDHAAQMARGLEIFKQQVRPLLLDKCLRCHGSKKLESEFDLSDRDKLLRGGTAGAAIVPGSARDSLLYRLVTHTKEPHMPYNSRRLSDAALAQIAAWIDCGAPYDKPLVDHAESNSWTKRTVPASARRHWAFQPLRQDAPPQVKHEGAVRTPIDRFIFAKQGTLGLEPNAAVNRRQLIRRATFDLLGLPPTPHEVEQFVRDPAADAYDRLLDRLLDSPHYGERWGRHWLDLVRFAESHGFEHDSDRPTAYHYRDFVIKALNADLPFDTFVKWQLAGDEFEPDNPLAQTATGFLAAGVHSTQITKNEVEKHRYDELDDMTAITGTAFLGLTVGCARCHDHKYDPIPQADYYRLLASFTTTVRSEIELRPTGTGPVPKGTKPRVVMALVASEGLPPLRLHTQGEDFFKESFFLRRGDPAQKEGVAHQGFLQVLTTAADPEVRWQGAPPKGWRTSYRRRALAEWLTDVDQGAGRLLARVIVNRLWQHHLGRGLVATPSNFGLRGDPPSHPELLDWLAGQLIQHHWHLKPIHRLIMASMVYQENGHYDPDKGRLDPDNRCCWYRPPGRLEAESIRDALLAVSGLLDPRMFGPGSLDESMRRRSIYFTVKRSKLVPMMQVFDAPDALGGIAERPTSTVAPQALFLMNNPNMRIYAKALARRVAAHATDSREEMLRTAYLTAFARLPTPDELSDARAFLSQEITSYAGAGKADAAELALADLCQVLLSANEFIYID
jgi:mono/diheme cytochrome c family protein